MDGTSVVPVAGCRCTLCQVYEMSPGAAQHGWAQLLLYTDAGAVVSTGSDGPLTYKHVSAASGPAPACVVHSSIPGSSAPAALLSTPFLLAPHALACCVLVQGATLLRLLPPAVSGRAGAAHHVVATLSSGVAVSAACCAAGATQPGVAPSAASGSSSSDGSAATPLDGVPPAPVSNTCDAAAHASMPRSSLSVVTPTGVCVELRTDGCVVLSSVQPAPCRVSCAVA
jgi:hypothetical protein